MKLPLIVHSSSDLWRILFDRWSSDKSHLKACFLSPLTALLTQNLFSRTLSGLATLVAMPVLLLVAIFWFQAVNGCNLNGL